MPWKKVRNHSQCPASKPVAVVKVSDGKVVGCHPSDAAANRQLAALHASEKKDQFRIFKDDDGTYRWCSIWTNKYRDDDNPPEILSEAAHIDYVNAVEREQSYPYPELWFWHIPGSRFGVADLVGYDLDSGMTIAAGTIDKGKERVAELLMVSPVELGVSHSMPGAEIERDKDDPSIITRYRTEEISPLPRSKAANKMTWMSVGVDNMKLVPEAVMKKLGAVFNEEETEEVANILELSGTEAKESGREFKEEETKEEAPEEEATPEVESKETPEEEEAVEEAVSTPVETKDETENLLTREEVADGINAATEMVLAEVVKAINETVTPLIEALQAQDARLQELEKPLEEKIAEVKEVTPRLSIRDMISASVIGRPEVAIDGRSSLAKSGPDQAEPEKESPVGRNVHPSMRAALANIINGEFFGTPATD